MSPKKELVTYFTLLSIIFNHLPNYEKFNHFNNYLLLLFSTINAISAIIIIQDFPNRMLKILSIKPSTKVRLRHYYSQVFNVLIPLTVFAGLCYGSYVFVQQIVIQCSHRELRQCRATVACLLIFYFLIISCLLGNWLMVFVNGAGLVNEKIKAYKLVTYYTLNDQGVKIPIEEDSEFSTPPEYFSCNSSGYPFYCAQCRSVKPLRARHSSSLKRCVYRMDHYCVYIGSVIGKNNYKNFLNFSMNFLVYFIYLFVNCLIYIPQQVNYRKSKELSGFKINPNLPVTLVISFIWIVCLGSLISQHLVYIALNVTTIERIQNKKSLKNNKEPTYINVLYKGKRYIVEMKLPIYPYTKSTFRENIYEIYGSNIISWIFPLRVVKENPANDNEKQKYFAFHEERFGEKFLQILHQKIQKKDAILLNSEILV